MPLKSENRMLATSLLHKKSHKTPFFDKDAFFTQYFDQQNLDKSPLYNGGHQFDHIYNYTRQHKSLHAMVKDDSAKELTALWLTAYLAHWGMFRGSGKISKSNTRFFKKMVEVLLEKRVGHLQVIASIKFDCIKKCDIEKFDQAIQKFSNWLNEEGIKPTDTLLSKTFLALTHNVPAFDKFFKSGLQKIIDKDPSAEQLSLKFNGENLYNLSQWYCRNKPWPSRKSSVATSHYLPAARILDITLFQYGKYLCKKIKKDELRLEA